MKNKNLALVAVLFTISIAMAFANGPTPPVYIDTDQIIDGAVDIIKTTGIADTSLSNVVPATGLAALGGASLNGSSTVDFSTKNLTIAGYTKFGMPIGLKTKILTGNTALTEGGQAVVLHDLVNKERIISVTGLVKTGTLAIAPSLGVAEYNWGIMWDNTKVIVANYPTTFGGSEAILNASFTLLVVYKE